MYRFLLQVNNATEYAGFINHFPSAIFMSMHNVIIYTSLSTFILLISSFISSFLFYLFIRIKSISIT